MFEVTLVLVYVVVAAFVALLAAVDHTQRAWACATANFMVGLAGGWTATVLFGKLGPHLFGLPLAWVFIGAVVAVVAEIAIVSLSPKADRRRLPRVPGPGVRRPSEAEEQPESVVRSGKRVA